MWPVLDHFKVNPPARPVHTLRGLSAARTHCACPILPVGPCAASTPDNSPLPPAPTCCSLTSAARFSTSLHSSSITISCCLFFSRSERYRSCISTYLLYSSVAVSPAAAAAAASPPGDRPGEPAAVPLPAAPPGVASPPLPPAAASSGRFPLAAAASMRCRCARSSATSCSAARRAASSLASASWWAARELCRQGRPM